jgi:Chitobiase/beta-hexosaminidase C-terminal domain
MISHRKDARTFALWMLALLPLSSAACRRTAAGHLMIGTATAQIRLVPVEVRCIVLEVHPSGTSTDTVTLAFDVAPEASTTFTLEGLPLGPDDFSASAFSVSCAARSTASATWVADPVQATVTIDAPVNVTLTMRLANPTGSATVGVDFPRALPIVSAPTFQPAPGVYAAPQAVTIATATPGASVRYTTDGSDPTETVGTPYAGPVTVATSVALKAIAYVDGWTTSSVTTGAYTIASPPPGVVWSSETSDPLPSLFGIWANPTTDDVWAVGAGGTILHRTGAGWSSEASPTTGDLYGVWGTSALDVFAVGIGGTILHRTTSGSWSSEAAPVDANLSSVWGNTDGDVWAVGGNATILHRADDGTWSGQTADTSNQLNAVWASAADDAWAVGGSPILHRLPSNWWTTSNSWGGDALLFGVWGSSASDVWAVGEGATTVRWDGNGWSSVANPLTTATTLFGIWGTSASEVWMVGSGGQTGTILRWDASGWSSETSGWTAGGWTGGIVLRGVSGRSASEVWAVAASEVGGAVLRRQ